MVGVVSLERLVTSYEQWKHHANQLTIVLRLLLFTDVDILPWMICLGTMHFFLQQRHAMHVHFMWGYLQKPARHTPYLLFQILLRKTIGERMIDFEVRRKQRETYPGACSLVYQHLIHIVIECLIGWDLNTKSGTRGIFGKLLTWARTDEEQGRTTLHGHWQLWVEDFNAHRAFFYHSDPATRKEAHQTLLKYVDEVISAN